ncbi:MAG: hypothetical protein U5N85_00360 [Arcicella sp.]|nr:hypothetical protein [Arcicella sp.]
MKLRTITSLLLLLLFSSCSNTKRIKELQNQVHILEQELSVRKHENMELSSFMVSLRKQFTKPFQHYIKICQTDDTDTIEIQKTKYTSLLHSYNLLQFFHKDLEQRFEIEKANTDKLILELRSESQSLQNTKKKYP